MKLLLIVLLSVILVSSTVLSVRAADFKAVGDVGCKSSAITNLKNIAKTGTSFFGIGDYSYKCSNSTIKPLWDKIVGKKGAMGNHECEKGQDSLKAGTTFQNGGCSKGYTVTVRGNNVAVFTLNPYTSYKAGSAQYKFVTDNLAKYSNMSNIIRMVFVYHEPIYPVNCSGSHCHGLEKPAFKSTYEPLAKQYNVFQISAHTHLTAFGTINGLPSAICGGGGEDGTSTNGLGAYTYSSSKMGFCAFHFEQGKTTVNHIGTSNTILHTHTWNQ